MIFESDERLRKRERRYLLNIPRMESGHNTIGQSVAEKLAAGEAAGPAPLVPKPRPLITGAEAEHTPFRECAPFI